MYPAGTLTRLRRAHEGLSHSIRQLEDDRAWAQTGRLHQDSINRFARWLRTADDNLTVIIRRIEAQSGK